MKKILLILSICILVCFTNKTLAYENGTYKVIKVIDGDTLFLDFNKDGIPQQEEKVRINGIDTFEVKPSVFLAWQMKEFSLTQDEALGLGYFGKEFAKKNLLNKYVKAEYSADSKLCDMGRQLMSISYDNGKNYEQEVLKAGLATVYKKSNFAPELYKYENLDKIKANVKKTHHLDLILLNKKKNIYHKVNCQYGLMSGNVELVNRNKINTAMPAICCFGCASKKEQEQRLFKKIQEAKIKLFFVDPLKNKKPKDTCENDACLSLLTLIQNSKESINFAIYGISNEDEIFYALVDAQKRGVKINGVTDVDENYKNIYSDTFRLISILKNVTVDFESTQKATEQSKKIYYKNGVNLPYKQVLEFDLENNKIEKTYVTKNGIEIQKGIMHDKFFIIDNRYVWTGSTNVSESCMTYNSNVAVVIDSPPVAKLYEQEFNQMYYEGKFHQYKSEIINNENIKFDDGSIISVYFSPKSLVFSKAIIPLIENAKQTIDIPMFFLTHYKVTQALIDAKLRGVNVRIILDAVGTSSAYSKHEILRKAGIPVKIENWGGKMHMKSMIIDNEIIVVGSTNWTSTAASTNDENLLVIKNHKLASEFSNEFDRLYLSIPSKWLKGKPEAEGRDSLNSCSDGIDNDHDGDIDKADSGCRIFFRVKTKELPYKQIEVTD